MPRKFETKLSLIKVSKGRCPKAFDDLDNLSVLCQVRRFTCAFCYQFLMIFCCFGYFLSIVQVYVTFIIPGSRDIAQVVKTVQIYLQKFRFTEQGSNLAFVLKNFTHNFYKMQKGHVYGIL